MVNRYSWWKENRNKHIKAVGYIHPPVIFTDSDGGKCIIPANNWSKNAVKTLKTKVRGADFDYFLWKEKPNPNYKIIDGNWDNKGGISAVIEMPLYLFIGSFPYNRYCSFDRENFFKIATICTAWNYRPTIKKIRGKEVEVCKDAEPEFLIVQHLSGGCNGGGGLVTPNAPTFSETLANERRKLLRRRSWERWHAFCKRPIITNKVDKLFPEQDWSCNRILEEAITRDMP